MGRNARRQFIKKCRSKGISSDTANLFWKMQRIKTAITLHEGDRVRLNIQSIQQHPDYKRLTAKYQHFIQTHADDIFTVVYDRRHQTNPALVCLKEDPNGFLFWVGDLIHIDNPSE